MTDWLEAGRRVAAGTLVAVDGSSPLDVGASVYIAEDETIEGSVTGGCVESAVAQEAMAILAEDGPPRLVTYGISDELAGTVGLMCGGTVHIFIHALRGDARAATLDALAAIRDERPAALATLLDGEDAGAKLYVDAEGTSGGLGGAELLERNVAQEARGLTTQGRSLIRDYGEDGASLGRGLRVHVAAFAEPPQMVIFGAIDFASALAPLAKGLGYRVTIADPRRAFLESPRFSAFANTVAAWPEKVLAEMELGPRDATLVFTHDPKLDVPAVQAALGSGAGYVGALGSRKTTADRNRRLARRVSRRRTSLASTHRVASTSDPPPSRRPRWPSSPRSSLAAPAARAGRCGAARGRSGATATSPRNSSAGAQAREPLA